MSTTWDHSFARSDAPREFLVSVELYISTSAGNSIRKPASTSAPWKKTDKKDSSKQLISSVDSESKKVNQKNSWLTLARGSSHGGNWRPATCKLTEEGERCLLNIYVDESILYQTMYIHLLHQTDIRHGDTSLFFRKHCLGIYCVAGQRWTSNNASEPVYLQFFNADICNTWLALLRSYAIPEIYGRWFFPADGGSYRMWRQVELTVIQGRNLGNTRLFDSATTGLADASESDPVDLDVSCEILLNDALCGRTTLKKGIGSPDWHESFCFSDLPPFDNLDIVVWREKKLFKPTVMGISRIALTNFRRGEAVEGWFPVLQPGPIANDLQVGEIRLKIRVDEEIVLPYTTYSGLLNVINSRNFLDWMADFETHLKLKTVSTQLMSIAVANNKLIEQVQQLAAREVDGSPTSHQTLFRGNTILTKVMELSMAWYGKPFLEASIGSVLRRLCAEKVAIEVDPVRSGKSNRDVEKNVDSLIYWCQEFWNQIYSVRSECPIELRRLFETIRRLVEARYQKADAQESRELPWQSVSAFCFLRFIVPAILHPHLFGLCPGLPIPPVQRSLTLIAKVIQSLANLNATVQKEEFMRGVKEFLKDSRPAMIDYILVVSTPMKHGYANPSGSNSDRHDRLRIVNALRERAKERPALDRESIPILPHLLDIPRDLAVITSAVIRNSREYLASQKVNETISSQPSLRDFCSKCFEVEEQALQRVSQLATRISSNHRRTSTSAAWNRNSNSPASPRTPTSPLSTSSPTKRKPVRPSTAPSASEAEKTRQAMLGPLPSPTALARPPDRVSSLGEPISPRAQRSTHRLLHLKSTSTDSIPSYVERGIIPTQPTAPEAPPELLEEMKRKKPLFRIFKR